MTTTKTKKKDQWDAIVYENISERKNEVIRLARRMGFAIFFPYSDHQGQLTFDAATKFLNS